MLDQLLNLFAALALSFVLYPVWISFVYKYHMREEIRNEGPKTHLIKRGTPTMGGFVFFVVVALMTFVFNRSRTQTLFPIFIASMAGLFGLLEDFAKVYKSSTLPVGRLGFLNRLFAVRILYPFRIGWHGFVEITRIIGSSKGRGIGSANKMLIQFAMAGFVSFWSYYKLGWDFIWFPLIGDVHIGLLYPVLIFFLFLAVMNFVAITDGIDGLAGGLGIIAFCAYWVISSMLGYYSLSTLAATFIGALLPFLYFNINPARIFMGDVGSHVLGAMLALFAIVIHREIALIFILAVFLFDGATSPLQQFSVKLTGKRLFRMAPIHHHFEILGWPEAKVTMRFWLAGAFCALVGILVALL